jgi:hypothetical protein
MESRKILVDEHTAAGMLGVSVSFLRKDRGGRRLIPFHRLGARVLYSPDRIKDALRELEEGGGRPSSKPRRGGSAVADAAVGSRRSS